MTGRGITPIAVDLVVPDLVAVAKGFGCAAERIADLDHFAAALAAAKTRDVPTVLELVAGHTDIGG